MMKNRDIKSLISFLKNYDLLDSEIMVRYDTYKLTSNYTKEKDHLPLNELDEEDVEDIDLEGDVIDNEAFIRIEDSVMILQERMKEYDVDLTNASFIHSIRDEMNEIWNKISDVKMNADYVILKEERNILLENIRTIKREWILAVVKRKAVLMDYRISGMEVKSQKVFPLGLYYNKFLEQYKCVYYDEKEQCNEIMLDEIENIMMYEDQYRKRIDFNIQEYIESIQTEKMTLRVFREGKVIDKLKKLLCDNKLQIVNEVEYDVFTFMTENPWQYNKIIKSFGKSVVVMEPDYIREDMIESTKEALSFYESEITKNIL